MNHMYLSCFKVIDTRGEQWNKSKKFQLWIIALYVKPSSVYHFSAKYKLLQYYLHYIITWLIVQFYFVISDKVS